MAPKQIRELQCGRWRKSHNCPIAPKGNVNGYDDGECPCLASLQRGKTVVEWRAEKGQPRTPDMVQQPQSRQLALGGAA